MQVSHRIDKVADEIQRQISSIFLFEMDDPRLQGLTVTRVRLTRDIGLARIYFQTHDPKKAESVGKLLKKSAGYIRLALSKKMSMKKLPQLEFFYDDTQDELVRVAHLLQDIESTDDDL